MLTIVVVLMAIIVDIEYERDVPWLLINCPGMGKAPVGFSGFLFILKDYVFKNPPDNNALVNTSTPHEYISTLVRKSVLPSNHYFH